MGLLSKDFEFVAPSAIKVAPERQRSDADARDEQLEGSIRERGVLNPLIVTRELELIAGERRLRAALALGIEFVPVRYDNDLSPLDKKIVELEENERRKDLHWKDQVRAISGLHELYAAKAETEGETWSVSRTAEMLFYSQPHMTRIMRIRRALDSDTEAKRIEQAPGMLAAYNVLLRLDERAIGDIMSDISRAGLKAAAASAAKGAGTAAQPNTGGQSPAGGTPAPAAPAPSPQYPEIGDEAQSILQSDFITWAEGYEGPLFNFIHCDFPFGVNLFEGEQGGKNKWTGYDDDPNVYWSLIRAFCENRDRFMAQSAHLMFWLSIDFLADTLAMFRELAPELRFCAKPLIWVKSDNVGVLSDPKRWPRHIYETALIASRDDRLIIQASSDAYVSPTDKAHHPSTKPEPMLHYFFKMFVDEHTKLLDPTCGSGAALRAAERHGAKYTLGLEIDPEHCANARVALRQARVKAKLAGGKRT